MATTQAFRTALHIPDNDPGANQVVGVVTPGALYVSAWQAGAAGSAFPTPAAQGQFLISGPGPGYAWGLDVLDAGTF